MSNQSGKLNFEIGEGATRADIGQNVGKRSVDGTSALKPDSDLSKAEKAAAKEVDDWSNVDQDGVNKAEEEAKWLYSGSGREEGEPRQTSFKGIAKRGGPVFTILFAVFVVAMIVTGTQMTQPFSLIAQFEETFNSMRVSANMRSRRFLKAQLSNRKDNDSEYSLFGEDLTLSKKQQDELRAKGIEYDDDYNGEKVLKYTDADGNEKIVNAGNFDDVYANDDDFFRKYNSASLTWRGAIAGWFQTNTRLFLKNNKLTRNLFDKYLERLAEAGLSPDTATSEQKKKAVVGLLKEHIKGKLGIKMKGENKGDDDPNELPVEGDRPKNQSEVKEKVKKVADFAAAGSDALCGALNIISAINLMVTADQALQVINLATSLFEAVDKTKTGDGVDSPVTVYEEALNTPVASRYAVIEEAEDAENNLKTTELTRERTAMESASIAGIFGGGRIDPYDPSVASFNIASNAKKIFHGLGTSMNTFELCSVARVTTSILGFILPVEGVLEHLGAKAISVGASVIVDLLVPTVAVSMMRDIISDLAGEDLGNAFVLGANMYLGSVHRANGGSLATLSKFKKYAAMQEQVIADNARYERLTMSPFDATSKYTFMGTIVHQLAAFTHANSVMSTLTAGGSAVSSSLVALNGTASAYNIAENLPDSIEEYALVNPHMAWIGAIGDQFGYQYAITDVGTIDSDPSDPPEKVAEYGGISGADSNGNPIVDKDSDYAIWLRDCANRQSAFGIPDQNIVNELAGTFDVNTSNSTVNTIANSVIGMIPYVGNVIDIVQGYEQLAYSGYISGESCVAGNDVQADLSPNWSKAKWYQRFTEDQTYAEASEMIEKSAASAYLEEYYKEHPLDNSYEGMLARYSGMTKDNVIALLDFIDYVDYIAHYDPSTRYAFGSSAVEPSSEIFFEKENVMSGDGILLGTIVYADVRNRSFAV